MTELARWVCRRYWDVGWEGVSMVEIKNEMGRGADFEHVGKRG